MGLFQLNRSSLVLIIIMICIFVGGLYYAHLYYENVNSSEDPRVYRAKELYASYNDLTVQKKYQEIFDLLDSIGLIYGQFEDYKNSYELGVLHNNRAAVLLNIAIFEEVSLIERDSIIKNAEAEVEEGIRIYNQWMDEFGDFNEDEIEQYFAPVYHNAFPDIEEDLLAKYIFKRRKEIIRAQKEMPRRLSVSHTNLGIVYRHRGQIEKAVESYQLAIELWDENITAKNNINVLLGRPLERPGLLKRLFPSDH